MRRVLLLVTILLISGTAMHAQFSELMKQSQVHGSFEFTGSYYMPDDAIGFTEDTINGRNFAFNGFGH